MSGISLTFCCRQSLHAIFTPGWCRPLLGVSLSSPLTPLRELRFRLRADASASGDAPPFGDKSAGDCIAPPGGSKEVPLAQDILLLNYCTRCAGVGMDNAQPTRLGILTAGGRRRCPTFPHSPRRSGKRGNKSVCRSLRAWSNLSSQGTDTLMIYLEF